MDKVLLHKIFEDSLYNKEKVKNNENKSEFREATYCNDIPTLISSRNSVSVCLPVSCMSQVGFLLHWPFLTLLLD